MTISLHRRLVLTLLGLILTSWSISVVLTTWLTQQTLTQQVDRQLMHYMDVSLHSVGMIYSDPVITEYYQSSAERIVTEQGVSRVRGFGGQGKDLATNLWFQGTQVLVGREAPVFPQPQHDDVENDGVVQVDIRHDGQVTTWRILYRYVESMDIWVAAGLNMATVSAMAKTAMLRSLFPLLVILPLTLGVLVWGVGRGLRPLQALASTIAARQPQALEAIELHSVPRELQPVVSALNDLLERLQQALINERRFTSNAAHELQTPLAAIKAEVQQARRQLNDGEGRQILTRIEVRVARATETVTQLLTLARLDPEQHFSHQTLALNPLLISVIADVGHVAVERNLDIHIEDDPELTIQGQEEWIKILLRNLLGNAFKYATAGGRVVVSLRKQADGIRLEVANDCETISEAQRQRLMDRFYSLPGREGGGVGLGLSIVQRIAELHGASIVLDSWEGETGFCVEVFFPRNASES